MEKLLSIFILLFFILSSNISCLKKINNDQDLLMLNIFGRLFNSSGILSNFTFRTNISEVIGRVNESVELEVSLYENDLEVESSVKEVTFSSTNDSIFSISRLETGKLSVLCKQAGSASIIIKNSNARISVPDHIISVVVSTTDEEIVTAPPPTGDTDPPAILSISPIASSIVIHTDVNIIFNFNEAILTNTTPELLFEVNINGSFISLDIAPSNIIFENSDQRLVFVYSYLPENTIYRVTLNKDRIIDSNNNTLASSYIFSFTTDKTNLKYHFRDTGQILCHDKDGTNLLCSSQFMDGSLVGLSSADFISNISYTIGFPNDPIVYDSEYQIYWKICSEGQSWLGTTCTPEPVSNTYTFHEAVSACSQLNRSNSSQGYAGKRYWRMPTIREIQGITDYSYPQYSGNGQIVERSKLVGLSKSKYYWSNTSRIDDKEYAFAIQTYAGKIYANNIKTSTYHVICVSK